MKTIVILLLTCSRSNDSVVMMVEEVVGEYLFSNAKSNMLIAHDFMADFRKFPARFNKPFPTLC
jgi:hypothetical protein